MTRIVVVLVVVQRILESVLRSVARHYRTTAIITMVLIEIVAVVVIDIGV